ISNRNHPAKTTQSSRSIAEWDVANQPTADRLFLVGLILRLSHPRIHTRRVLMLELQNFLIKEQVGFLKLTDTYDIFNPESGEQVAQAKEVVNGLTKALRLIISKKLMPIRFECREHPDGSLVFYLKKPVGFFRSVVEVYDADGKKLGYFKS